jgi:hypothetical protein
MANAHDIQLTDTHDLKVVAGDFVVNDSTERHLLHIFLAHKGHYKSDALLGFGGGDWISATFNARITQQFRTELSKQLEYDNFKSISIDTSGGFRYLKIKANRG